MATDMLLKPLVTFLVMTAFAVNVNAQGDNEMISLVDVQIPGIITYGAYSQLLEMQGEPKKRFTTFINPINPECLVDGVAIAPKNKTRVEYLIYDAYNYIHVGDSVQLVFVDLRKTKHSICIKDVVLSAKTTQTVFISEISQKGWWSDGQSHYMVGGIESHYYTHSNIRTFGVDFKEDPYTSVCFAFYDRLFDKRIWWIEFPIMRIGGIVH